MCLGAGIAAAIGAISSVASTVAGIAGAAQQAQQAQQQAEYQRQLAHNQRLQSDVQAQQQRMQADLDRQAQVRQHQSQVRAQQREQYAYYENLRNNNRQANKAYVQEQVKRQEIRDKAAFAGQENYIKSIQGIGSILATGGTGQSYGLMALDAERKQGFADAQQNATIRSADAQAGVGMDLAFSQATSANNEAFSRVSLPVQAPQFGIDPTAGYELVTGEKIAPLGVPTYNWS